MSCRRSCAALLLAAAALVAGCGKDTSVQNAYVGDVQRAQSSFVTRFGQALDRLTATSTLAQDRATLREFGLITERFGTTLSRIKPPASVRGQHRALVAAVARFRQQFVLTDVRLRRGSVTDRAEVRTQLSSSVDDTQAQIGKAIAQINTGLRE